MRELTLAIRDLHGCDSTWVESVPVTETFQGQTVWDGTVEVFVLRGHPTATRCYAWSHAVDGSEKRRYVAVLQPRASGLAGGGCQSCYCRGIPPEGGMMFPGNKADLDAIEDALKDGPFLHCALCGQEGLVPDQVSVHGQDWLAGNRLSLRFFIACVNEPNCLERRQSN